MSELLFPLQFKRQYSGPLDVDNVFATSAAMSAYLTDPLRYAGQIATCLDYPSQIFVMNSAMNAWNSVSSSATSATVNIADLKGAVQGYVVYGTSAGGLQSSQGVNIDDNELLQGFSVTTFDDQRSDIFLNNNTSDWDVGHYVWNRAASDGAMFGLGYMTSGLTTPTFYDATITWSSASPNLEYDVGINIPSSATYNIGGVPHNHDGRYASSAHNHDGQYLAISTSGLFATSGHTHPDASSTTTGFLTSGDWTTFNNKITSASLVSSGIYFNSTTSAISATPYNVYTDVQSVTERLINNTVPAIIVDAATTTNITLSSTQTIDGIALVAGNIVLVKNQTTTSANGVYVVGSGTWTRDTRFDSESDARLTSVYVRQGTAARGKWYMLSNAAGAVTINTSGLTFAQIPAGIGIASNQAAAGDHTHSGMVTTATAGGVSNYVSKFTGAATIRVSNIYDNGTSLGYNTSSFDATAVERFKVDTGVTSSYNNATFTGYVDNYMQVKINNRSSAINASSDLVLINDTGNETSGYIDFGINSSRYNSSAYNIGTSGDGYLYIANGNLAIGTDTIGKNIIFHVGGTTTSDKSLTLTRTSALFQYDVDTLGSYRVSGTALNTRNLSDVSSAVATNGQILVYSSATSKYVPTSIASTVTKLTGSFVTTSGTSGSNNVSLGTNLTRPYSVQFFDLSDTYNVIQNYAVTNYADNGFTVTWNAGSPYRTVYWVVIG